MCSPSRLDLHRRFYISGFKGATTVTRGAALFRPGQAELVAQHIQQGLLYLAEELYRLPIEGG